MADCKELVLDSAFKASEALSNLAMLLFGADDISFSKHEWEAMGFKINGMNIELSRIIESIMSKED